MGSGLDEDRTLISNDGLSDVSRASYIYGSSPVVSSSPVGGSSSIDENAASKLFVSYAREDKKSTEVLIDRLQAENWTVFWDQRILAGQIWRNEIRKKIDDADAVIVLWSKKSFKGNAWVCAEAAWGEKKLFPIRLDDVNPPQPFDDRNAYDLFSIRNTGVIDEFEFRRLARNLRVKAPLPPSSSPRMPTLPYPFVGRDGQLQQILSAIDANPPQPVAVFCNQFVGKTGL